MQTLVSFSTPQLVRLHRGKVRDSFRIDAESRLIVAVLETAIPGKGAVLNRLSAYWFEKTRDLVPNHMVEVVADRAMVVRELEPIRVEMIVRGYMTGSAWRAYASGERRLSGVKLPDGLSNHQRFRDPIVTPTTKDVRDSRITPEAIVAGGLATETVYRKMEAYALSLFSHASKLLDDRGLLLVDSKYEFGLLNGEVVLMDEIHTPDSSRFWSADDYDRDPQSVTSWDKEYVRRWLLAEREAGRDPEALPADVVAETQRRYAELCERITGKPVPLVSENPNSRLIRQLVAAGIMKDACVTLVIGSPSDRRHADVIIDHLAAYDVAVRVRIASAHKTPAHTEALARELSASAEPGVIIAVAGRSNGLGGALAANTTVPVINCPPFADRTDLAVNIGSSLMMPSFVPAMTVIEPKNAAEAAIRCLNLPRLRRRCAEEISERRSRLQAADEALKEGGQ